MAEGCPMMVDPPVVQLPASGGVSVHQVINATGQRLAFKMKSSNNKDYLLKPVFSFVEPGGSQPLVITRRPGPPKVDKLVVQCKEVPPDCTDPQAAFKDGHILSEVVIPMNAE